MPAACPSAWLKPVVGLHQRIETATIRPWSDMAVSRKRYVNDAGIDPRGVLRRKTEIGQRTRAIALRENIGLREQLSQPLPALVALEFDKTCKLAATGIDREPGDRRQLRSRHQQHIGAMRGERAAGDGAGDHT